MATIYIDNKPYQANEKQNLLHACLSLGFNIPYFCWHPAMNSVGACRQCAVKEFKDENDKRGKIVMSCMTAVRDGLRISIDDPEVKEFRARVIEWLMTNHPHDCPVCDEGGECHLQDMTVMTGHVYRRFRFRKRTYVNQDLGPFVNHEMNRCIQCYRCVRFYNEYADGRDFGVFACHNHVYFGRHKDGVLESKFSGNLVEVCPTGVFTDKTLKRHYTRKWDLQTAPSICPHCGMGCNTIPGERYGTLRRIRTRYSGQVNGYFICDRGRYGYEFVNSPERIKDPLRRVSGEGAGPGKYAPFEKGTALGAIKDVLNVSRGVMGIGSPRASLEANFALKKLVGAENFFLGIPDADYRILSLVLDIYTKGSARTPTLDEVESSDAILILGEDVSSTAPRLALAIRQAVKRKSFEAAGGMTIPYWDDKAVRIAAGGRRNPLFILSCSHTGLDDMAKERYFAAPDDLARLAFAFASRIDTGAPGPEGMSPDFKDLTARICGALESSKNPLIVCGAGAKNEGLVQGAANLAWALRKQGKSAFLSFVLPGANELGLGIIGGRPVADALKAIGEQKADTVIALENDLYRSLDKKNADTLLSAKFSITLDQISNETTKKSWAVLPAASFAESEGTYVNFEGRAQRFYKVFVQGGGTEESWKWLRDIMLEAGRPEASNWDTLDGILRDMANEIPVLAPITGIAPPETFRIAGMKVPRQPHRYSGRTAMHADKSLLEPKPPEDRDSALSFSMEGYAGVPPPALIQRFWAPGWNSVQALNKFQSEVGGPLRGGDPGKRLFEPGPGASPAYFAQVPPGFQPRKDEWLLLPVYHIFGSEELSMHAPGIASLAPDPYIALSEQDRLQLGKQEGEYMEVGIGETSYSLPVKPVRELPEGIALMPSGLPGLSGIGFPVWIKKPGKGARR